MKTNQLTDDQIENLRRFAQQNGRTWKSKLRTAWESFSYADVDIRDCSMSTLHFLRSASNFGPTGLIRFRLDNPRNTGEFAIVIRGECNALSRNVIDHDGDWVSARPGSDEAKSAIVARNSGLWSGKLVPYGALAIIPMEGPIGDAIADHIADLLNRFPIPASVFDLPKSEPLPASAQAAQKITDAVVDRRITEAHIS